MAHLVLLADDSITIRKVVELSFQGTDIRVEAVSSGQEALERLETIQPDLILADVIMPEPSGYELCRQVKQSGHPVPVLLLRGAFEPFDEQLAAGCGADGHLVKPFDSDLLVSRVTALLREPEEVVLEPAGEEILQSEEDQEEAAGEAVALLEDLAAEASFNDGPAGEIEEAARTPEPAPEGASSDETQVSNDSTTGHESPAAPSSAMVREIAEKVIREIAWEVVPELAETLIRKRIREIEKE
jgi:CheY-like chemotaxis protein